MFRQIEKIVVAAIVALVGLGLVAGIIREGFVIGLLTLVILIVVLVPKTWQPLLRVVATMFALAVFACVLHSFFVSLASGSLDTQALPALLLVTLSAYAYRKLRQRKVPQPPRLAGAERTPVLPPTNEEAE